MKLSASITNSGFANKGVYWSIDSAAETKHASINQEGKLQIPADYDSTGNGTAGVYTIAITSALATGDKISVDGIEYTVAAADDTVAEQVAALQTALNVTTITTNYAISGSSPNTILTEASGKYGQVGMPTVVLTKTSGSTGAITVTETTEGALAGNKIIVTATSVFDNDESGTALITVV